MYRDIRDPRDARIHGPRARKADEEILREGILPTTRPTLTRQSSDKGRRGVQRRHEGTTADSNGREIVERRKLFSKFDRIDFSAPLPAPSDECAGRVRDRNSANKKNLQLFLGIAAPGVSRASYSAPNTVRWFPVRSIAPSQIAS